MVTPLECSLEGLDKYLYENRQYDWQTTRARFRAILRAYDRIYDSDRDRYRILEVERVLTSRCVSLLNNRDSDYIAAGKIDLTLQELTGSEQLIVCDHKFLESHVTEQYIRHLKIAPQVMQYVYLLLANGIDAEAVIFDIIIKSLHKQSKKESIQEFEERVLGIYLENPEVKFMRPKVQINKSNVANHVQDLYDCAMEMKSMENVEHPRRNANACVMGRYSCEYLDLCEGDSSEDDGTWMWVERIHPELELPPGVNHKRVITYSSSKRFDTCRLQYRRKQQGLVKIGKKLEAPLYDGSAGHLALEERFKCLQKLQSASYQESKELQVNLLAS